MGRRSIWGVALVAVVASGLGIAIPGAATVWHLNMSSAVLGSGGVLLVAGSVLLVAGSVLGFVVWMMSLMRTAQLSRWGWFVAVFLLGILGALLYGFACSGVSGGSAASGQTYGSAGSSVQP